MRAKLMAVLLTAAAAAAAVVAARRRGGEARSGGKDGQQPLAREPWSCACGQRYLVAGRDRHRIYWLEGAPESDPLLSDHCPSCERPLPAEHEASAATLPG